MVKNCNDYSTYLAERYMIQIFKNTCFQIQSHFLNGLKFVLTIPHKLPYKMFHLLK